ncbi:hypothetical protein NMG60_11029055 [Bertholletia excelsa]
MAIVSIKPTDEFLVDIYGALQGGSWKKNIKPLLIEKYHNFEIKFTRKAENILHLAVIQNRVKVIKKILKEKPSDRFLNTRTGYGSTALTLAATGGNLEVVKLLVECHERLLMEPDSFDRLPVLVAAYCGHADVARWLFDRTPEELLRDNSRFQSVELLKTYIIAGQHDVALRLLKLWENPGDMIRTGEDTLENDVEDILDMLANRSSPPTSLFHPLQRLIHSTLDPSSLTSSKSSRSQLFWNFLTHCGMVPFTEIVYKTLEKQLVDCIWKKIKDGRRRWIAYTIQGPLFAAASCGNVEFIEAMGKHYPDILSFVNEKNQTLLAVSIFHQRIKVFNYLSKMGATTFAMFPAPEEDTILHEAAKMSQLDRITGAPLQMQGELQWFQAIEKIAPGLANNKNEDGDTPRALFTKQHKRLVTKGEKWMKDVADSCATVAALIVTMMFAAAFTVPGGNNGDTGLPIFEGSNYFVIFVTADAIALFFSSSSVMIFLGMHTSLYREQDFLKSVPTKLIAGLLTLFLSLVAMMVTFSMTIVLMFRQRIVWISILMLMAASIPVTIFALSQFPLLLQILWNTYRPRVFHSLK